MKNRIRQTWIYQVNGQTLEHPPRGNVVYESPPEAEPLSRLQMKKKLLIFLGILMVSAISVQVMFWLAGDNGRYDQEVFKTDLTQISVYYRKLVSKDPPPGVSAEVDVGKQKEGVVQHHPSE
ncbi:MAG: hypothetical protein ACFHW5_11925 [Verrucomicrobiota bacterium]|jgi:hypothetical protein